MQAAELSRLRQQGGTIPHQSYRRLPKDLRTTDHIHPLEWEDHFAPVRVRDGQGEMGPLFIKRIFSPDHVQPTSRRKPPLVMFPPYGCNGNFYRVDADGRVLSLNTDESMANFFASRGRDVYVVHPSYCERIYRRYVERFPGVPYQFAGRAGFETLLERDVPAVIDYVRHVTGAEYVDWLGMSMGGLLMYAYLATHPDAPVRRVVAIGSPIVFGDDFVFRVAQFNAVIARVMGKMDRAPVEVASSLVTTASWLLSQLPPNARRFIPLLEYIYNRNNLDPRVEAALLSKVLESPGPALTHSFVRWIRTREFPYRPTMGNIRTPFLLVTGEKDQIAPPSGVKAAAAAMKSADVQVLVIGDAGHVDLVLGRRSKEQVFEPALKFFE